MHNGEVCATDRAHAMEGSQFVLLGFLVWLASCDPEIGHDLAHALQHSLVHMPTDVSDGLHPHGKCHSSAHKGDAYPGFSAVLAAIGDQVTAHEQLRLLNTEEESMSWLTGGQSSLERLSVVGTSVLLSVSSMSYTKAVRIGRNISLAGVLNGLNMALYTACPAGVMNLRSCPCNELVSQVSPW